MWVEGNDFLSTQVDKSEISKKSLVGNLGSWEEFEQLEGNLATFVHENMLKV